MNDEKARIEIQRSVKAKELLENPVLSDAVESYREQLLKYIEESSPDQKDERESAYQQLTALKIVVSRIKEFIDSGKFAEKFLEEIRTNRRIN